MKKLFLIIAVMGLVSGPAAISQVTPKEKGLQTITMEAIKGQLEFLSSDWMEGRETGEKGYYLASDYVASMFKVFGVPPAGDAAMGGGRGSYMGRSQQGGSAVREKSYFQNFTLLETVPGGSSTLVVRKNGSEFVFDEGIDFSLGRGAISTKFDAPVVFVGYGLVDKANGIDDFAGVDLKGKVILRLSGFPGSSDSKSPMYKKLVGDNPRAQFEMTTRKSDALKNLGVAGVIDIALNTDIGRRMGVYKFDNIMSPAENTTRTLPRMRLDTKEIISAPVSLAVTEKIINLLLKDSSVDIARYEKDAAAGLVKFKPIPIPGTMAGVDISSKSKRINVRNVVAVIEGENPNEFVAVGGHLDHMGEAFGNIWNGADDNASGTVAVMTIAKAFAASGVKPKRTIMFCAWCGEEEGLLGSEYFTLNPALGKIADYKFYMNFDMIARDIATDTAKNMAGITYTKAYPKLEEISKSYKDQYKLNLNLSIRSADAPTGGSDYTAFSDNKIPVIAWMAAMHTDYHKPTDQVNLVNWNKMLNIIKLGYLQMWDAANGEIK
jgi:hypothetical protein